MNAIIAKLKQAQAQQAKQSTDPNKEVLAPFESTAAYANGVRKTGSRGRPRKAIRVSLTESFPPFEAWAQERIVHAPGNVVCSGDAVPKRKRVGPLSSVIHHAEYPRRTLLQDLEQYCNALGLKVRIPRTLRGWIINYCQRRGWEDVRPHRTTDLRRAAIIGINLAGQPEWDGDDRFFGPDRQRWKPTKT